MKYNTDRAITSIEEDLLGRASFSKQLGKAIYEYKGRDSLVIGLFGKWGTGKTSVVNMALNSLETLSNGDDNKPIIIRFAPWNYSDKDNLIYQFFNSLKSRIDKDDNEAMKNKVGKALNDYSGVFDATSLVPVVGPVLAPILKTAAQAGGNMLAKPADLDSSREKLEKALIEVNQKIVILIDDIDRLTNSQIRDVFQLVKQVGDLPNIIYILAMDREVVKRALSEVHNFDGNEYLEKIIQIPFEIPELKKTKLHNIFFKKLDEVISEMPCEIKWDQQYWSNVFTNCIEPYLNTLRDVNRVINTFQFRYGMLCQETAFEDMVGITTIEVLEPELYKWICNNKESVCGGFMHSILEDRKNPIDYRKKYEDEFIQLGINSGKAIKCVATLFPVFANDVKEHFYGYQQSTNTRGQMRVAHEGRFELYFMLDLSDIKVPRSVINNCIYTLEREELKKTILEINNEGNIIYFIDEMRSLIDKVPYERIELIAETLLGIQSGFYGESSKAIFTISACDLAGYCADDLINKLQTEEERYRVIKGGLEKADKNGLGAMAHAINRIELAYARLASKTEKKEDQIITLEHLLEIEKIYVKIIKSVQPQKDLLEVKEFNFLFYLWKCFDHEGSSNFIKSIIDDEVLRLRFICGMAGRWNGTNGSGWNFNESNYLEYVSDEEIHKWISDYDKMKLDEFSDVEKIKLASFILNYQKDEMYHVNETRALLLVKEWEREAK